MISSGGAFKITMDDYKYSNDYRYLIDIFTLERIQERALYWKNVAKSYIEEAGLDDQTTINYLCLSNMVCSYFSDINRLKEFHPIDTANRIKVISYEVFWFLRTSPVQIIGDISQKHIFLNQKIAVNVIVSEFFNKCKNKKDVKAHLALAEELLYCFKYRLYTSQSIEMAINSYLVGSGGFSNIH